MSVSFAKNSLASGLARCPTTVSIQSNNSSTTTTGAEYGAPHKETARTLPVRPPSPASVMHRSESLQFPAMSHSHAVHNATSTERRYSLRPAATNSHISADSRLETCSTTTAENFKPALRTLPAALIRKAAAEPNKFTHYCSGDDWTTARRQSSAINHGSPPPRQRKRYLVTKNAGSCPITGSHCVVENP